jgi:hypothetical protein
MTTEKAASDAVLALRESDVELYALVRTDDKGNQANLLYLIGRDAVDHYLALGGKSVAWLRNQLYERGLVVPCACATERPVEIHRLHSVFELEVMG